jgi:hypothetical protein
LNTYVWWIYNKRKRSKEEKKKETIKRPLVNRLVNILKLRPSEPSGQKKTLSAIPCRYVISASLIGQENVTESTNDKVIKLA